MRWLVFLLFLLSLIYSNSAVCTDWFKIQKWDLCGQVEWEYKLTHKELMDMNPGVDCLSLQIGDTLCVRMKEEKTEECKLSYKAQNRDSCSGLIQDYRLSKRQFQQLNPHVDCDNLMENQLICLEGIYSHAVQ